MEALRCFLADVLRRDYSDALAVCLLDGSVTGKMPVTPAAGLSRADSLVALEGKR